MEYWVNRMAEAQNAITNKHIKDIEKQLSKYYRKAMEKTIKEFESTYDKLQATIKDGIEPTPADLYNLDKYWEMQAQLANELEKLGTKQVNLLSEKFEKQYFDIYDSISIPSAVSYSTADTAVAKQLINEIWVADGKSFSQRIWGNTRELIDTLNDELIYCVTNGKDTNQLKQLLIEKFNVSYNRADSIIRTETAHIQTQAAKQRYIDYGIKEVEILADKDEKCGKLHKKRYPINSIMPVPAHPNCRCCIIPVIDK